MHYNFDQLAFPPAHPTRSPRDTFFLDSERLLRTETSPSQIHTLEAKGPPIYMVSIGRVYRRDEITATRFPIFHQFEGLAVDRTSRSRTSRGRCSTSCARSSAGSPRSLPHPLLPLHRAVDRAGRLVPDLRHGGLPHVQVHGLGRARRRRDGRPAGLRVNVGLDPEEWTGFAFGCGIERAAQLRHGISEIRPFWENDLRVLRQF